MMGVCAGNHVTGINQSYLILPTVSVDCRDTLSFISFSPCPISHQPSNKRRFKPTTSVTKRQKKTDPQLDRSNPPDIQVTSAQQQLAVDTGNEPSNTLEGDERGDISKEGTTPYAPVQKPPLDPDAVLRIIRAHVEQQSSKRKPPRNGVSKDVLKQQGEIKRRRLEQEKQVKEGKDGPNEQVATPQVTMVNGEIVLDPSSLSYSAPSTPRQEIVEVVHEEKNENLVDKNVKRKRKGIPKQWTQQEEELLYELFKEHGLAFHKISEYIPGRDAKNIQKKYDKECKLNPFKISEAFKR
ncbi:predicted protein [Lichtheimia corymbifera JMRC:FSU:9682]|uniref:Myb-like domain-containing protein n=1 Tax=Lichtheimia corymbifera JMRC:FSU:9682 TaxID=1263082 RepID=A0A068RRE4_9FUNG|nr:predicted protein [Lichtheimia corymbifera JMRC:FSU:9682]